MYLVYILHCFLLQFHLGRHMQLSVWGKYQQQHIAGFLCKDCLIYMGFDRIQKYTKVLMGSLDQHDIQVQDLVLLKILMIQSFVTVCTTYS